MVWVDQDRCPSRYHDPVWIAAGGMGDLYRAVDEELERPVAIKVLSERFAGDEGVRSRFRREALAAARLSGEPNTVTIFDVGEWRGTPFIVMEYLGGGTLEQALRGGAQPLARSIRWLEQAARSLDTAHARGVIHRDIKPANLLLDERRDVRVGDFGIATAAGLDSLTLTGTTLGTVGYLAPEQAQGRPVSGATDQYALAVVAYELLTGTRPFARESSAAEAAAHVYEPVPSAAEMNRALPRNVDATFSKALAKDPAARFASCADFTAALRSTLQPRAGTTATPATLPIARAEQPTTVIQRRRKRSPLLAVAAGLVGLAAAGLAVALVDRNSNPTPQVAAPPATRTVTATTTITATTTTTTTPPAASGGSSSLPGPSGASDLNTRGYRLMLAGNYAAALPLLREAVAGLADPANPVTAYANFNLGQTLVQLGQCASAIPYLQRAEQLEPSRHEVKDAIRYAEQCAGGGPAGPGHGNGRGSRNGNQND
jgi:serine/threonine-protein kinase